MLAIRALLGHELGRTDPCARLDAELLGPTARQGDRYPRWLEKYQRELNWSREDFVKHHDLKYGGRLPVWAAVEIIDWGSLMRLYNFAPAGVREDVADSCGFSPSQLASWLKSLNVVRNTCAHHSRLFNRVNTLTPKIPPVGRHADLDASAADWSRTFGQLTLAQFLSDRLGLGRSSLLRAVLKAIQQFRPCPSRTWTSLTTGSPAVRSGPDEAVSEVEP